MSAPHLDERFERVLRFGVGNTLELNGHHYDYSLLGPTGGPVMVLVAGLSMHRCEWTPELLLALHGRGLRTLVVDNRDAGLSRAAEPSDEVGLAGMADDLLRLIVALGLDRVHVTGFSMGGMIAQHMAIRAPERVASLVSLMSTTGARGVGRPHERCHWMFTEQAPTDRAGYVEYAVRYHRAMVSPGDVDEDRARLIGGRIFDRGVRTEGTRRQLAAIRADGDRSDRLATLRVPTLVVHGTADPMIDFSGGEATAASIRGARFVALEGAGHSVSAARAQEVADLIAEHVHARD